MTNEAKLDFLQKELDRGLESWIFFLRKSEEKKENLSRLFQKRFSN